MARHANGTLIRKAREGLGVPLLGLARAVGISTTDLQAIEMGQRNAAGSQVVKIADWLQVNPETFYDPPDDDRYRGAKGRVGTTIQQGDFSTLDERSAKQRELAGLQQWVANASQADILRHPEQVQRCRDLELELHGQSRISDDWAKALGIADTSQPSGKTVADYQREHAERLRQQRLATDQPAPEHAWRTE